MLLRIGLTGGIGSGKSTVTELFVHHRVPVIDADEIARQLVAPGAPAYAEVVQTFGAAVLNTQRELDRSQLRALIFADPEKRKRLEAILHPRIRIEIGTQARKLSGPYCLIVIPLLVEANMQDVVDRILVVDAHEDLQISRVALRGWNKNEIRRALAAQIGRQERLRHAHDVIENNGDLAQLTQRVEALHHAYLALAGKTPS